MQILKFCAKYFQTCLLTCFLSKEKSQYRMCEVAYGGLYIFLYFYCYIIQRFSNPCTHGVNHVLLDDQI